MIDLRTGIEVELEGPGPLVGEPRVDIRHRSLYPEAGHNTDIDVLPGWHGCRRRQPCGTSTRKSVDESPAVRAYLGYLRDRPDSIVDALRDVAGADGAAIVHCAAGKDRTGVVCALALEVAGVPREAIVADYVATDERIHAIVARLAASPTYAGDIHLDQTDRHRPRAETMQRVLRAAGRPPRRRRRLAGDPRVRRRRRGAPARAAQRLSSSSATRRSSGVVTFRFSRGAGTIPTRPPSASTRPASSVAAASVAAS